MLLDPDSCLENIGGGILFQLRVRVPFSVFEIIVDKFRINPEWNIYEVPSSKRDRPCLLELKVMSSQYIRMSSFRGISALKANAIFTTIAMVTQLMLFLFSVDHSRRILSECESEGSWVTSSSFNHALQVCEAQPRWVTYKKPTE